MFVLGIDPGLTRTGYAVIETGSTLAVATAGVIRTSAETREPLRLKELYEDLVEVVSEQSPDEVAIERVFVNQNRQTAMSVGRASGIAMLAAAEIPVFEYTPTAVKSAIAGYGSADKRQLGQMVARRLGLSSVPEPHDVADAMAVALCHLQSSLRPRLQSQTAERQRA